MDLSWIQRHVLLVLLRNRTARVKELIPADVPANQFSYHLEGLVTTGLVEKVARGIYGLTSSGETFVGSFSTETDTVVKDVKTVIMFYGKKDGKQLLFRWSRQPYLDAVTLPYDRLAFGLSIDEGVIKAVKDKLGSHVSVYYKCSMLVKIFHEKKLISHMNSLIYTVDVDELALPFASRNGELFLDTMQHTSPMEGLEKLIEAIESDDALSEVVLTY